MVRKARAPLAATNSNAILPPPAEPQTKRQAKPQEKPKQPSDDALSSLKRKAMDGNLSDSDDDVPITDNCNQIRRKIRAVLNAGEMKIGALQKAMGVTPKSYTTFMSKSGAWDGQFTATYPAVARYFYIREKVGVQLPKKRVKREDEDKNNDVSGVHLDGEADCSVPVYDSCDEVRKKINTYLRDPKVTQAGFLREIAKTYPEEKKIQSKLLNDFLGKKGASAGNTSSVFYASYVFFEKIRIRDGKPKSGHREEMEKIWRRPGFDRSRRNEWAFCTVGQVPYEDQYGKMQLAG